MSKRPTADFIEILAESDVPVTESEMETVLKTEVAGAGSNLSNDSEMSPFWRWVRSAVVTPVVWLIRVLLAEHVMPNMFVATAQRWALELKAWDHDITPKDAEKTKGYITFTKSNPEDAVTLNAGTIIQTLPIENKIYKVQVISETVIAEGEATGEVLTEATEAGKDHNLPAGYFNILPQGVSGIDSVTNQVDWITKLGADKETDEELALRIQNAFTSAGEWHIDDVYRSIISETAGIRSDNIYFENTGHITPATANALILMEVGATPQAILDQLNEKIMTDGYHGHGDVLSCIAMYETLHDVITDVVLVANLTDQQKANELLEVENRIRAAFRETAAFPEMTRTRPQSRFSLSQLGTEIHNNMENVLSLTFTVDAAVQTDIVSALAQPRLQSLIVRELTNE